MVEFLYRNRAEVAQAAFCFHLFGKMCFLATLSSMSAVSVAPNESHLPLPSEVIMHFPTGQTISEEAPYHPRGVDTQDRTNGSGRGVR